MQLICKYLYILCFCLYDYDGSLFQFLLLFCVSSRRDTVNWKKNFKEEFKLKFETRLCFLLVELGVGISEI